MSAPHAIERAPVRLPRVDAPPHDPKPLLLAPWLGPQAMAGWRLRKLVGTHLAAPGATLQLAPTPEAERRLTEPSGSFGGQRLPPHLALADNGALLLLDRAGSRVLAFDACACRFVEMPCSLRPAPPQPLGFLPLSLLSSPSAIAIHGSRLYVADTGHARVLVLSQPGLVPRGALQLPAAEAAELASAGSAWRPSDMAVDAHGRLFVLDAQHGRIDRFDAQGHGLAPALAVPGAVALMLDGAGLPIVSTRTDHALAMAALPAAGTPVFAEFDNGQAMTDWQGLLIDGLAAGDAFEVAVMVASQAIGTAQLAQLPAQDWRAWAPRFDNTRAGAQQALALDVGAVLRVRVTPLAGNPALLITARAASAWRVQTSTAPATLEVLDVRAALLKAAPMPEPPVPVLVDAWGRFFAGCEDAHGELQWRAFDERGNALVGVAPPLWRFKRSGTARTVMLDSGIDGCPWHRVELRASVPEGCALRLRAMSSPIELSETEIDALNPADWCATGNSHGAGQATIRDELLRCPPGRWLCLELTLLGDGHATPCVESLLVEYPRVSLRRFLPAVFGEDPMGADFTDRFTALFDATLRSIEGKLDRLPSYFDPLSAPAGEGADFLSWLASWVGETLVPELPEAQRRHMLKQSAKLYALRGTREGLRRQLMLLLGLDSALATCPDLRPRTRCAPRPLNCGTPPRGTAATAPPLILEHHQLRRWLYAGMGRLGDDSRLWGASIANRSQLGANAQVGVTQTMATPDPLRDPLHVHAHRISVFVPAAVQGQPAMARALAGLLRRETPASTAVDVVFVEPRFRVGQQAMIGLDSVIARTPRGVRVVGEGSTPSPSATPPPQHLGQGTVLGAPTQPFERVGASRIGAGMVLT